MRIKTRKERENFKQTGSSNKKRERREELELLIDKFNNFRMNMLGTDAIALSPQINEVNEYINNVAIQVHAIKNLI